MAFGQIFFSLSAGMGLTNTMASYDKATHIGRTFLHALAVVLISFILQMFIGVTAICFAGYLARQDDKLLEDVISSGTGHSALSFGVMS